MSADGDKHDHVVWGLEKYNVVDRRTPGCERGIGVDRTVVVDAYLGEILVDINGSTIGNDRLEEKSNRIRTYRDSTPTMKCHILQLSRSTTTALAARLH